VGVVAEVCLEIPGLLRLIPKEKDFGDGRATKERRKTGSLWYQSGIISGAASSCFCEKRQFRGVVGIIKGRKTVEVIKATHRERRRWKGNMEHAVNHAHREELNRYKGGLGEKGTDKHAQNWV